MQKLKNQKKIATLKAIARKQKSSGPFPVYIRAFIKRTVFQGINPNVGKVARKKVA